MNQWTLQAANAYDTGGPRMLGFVATRIYNLIHFGKTKSRTLVPPASDQVDSRPGGAHAAHF